MLQLRLKWSNLWLRRLSAPYKPNQVILFLIISVVASVADPHHIDADPDPNAQHWLWLRKYFFFFGKVLK
jgi:hypothetical protein